MTAVDEPGERRRAAVIPLATRPPRQAGRPDARFEFRRLERRMEMHAKRVCTVLALALICACEMGESDDLDVGSSVQEVKVGDILDKIADTEPGSPVMFPPGTRPEEIDAAMKQLHAKLKPKEDKPKELEADPDFERGLSEKQKRGLKKVKDGYTQKVDSGDIKPVKKGGRWELEVKGPPSGKEPGPPERMGSTQQLRHEDGSTARPGDGSTQSVLPHFTDNYYTWSISWNWWGIKICVDHDFLYILCNYVTWFLNNSPISGWIKTALSILGCLPHTLDFSNDGTCCYVTWIGVAWCT
jgi:hypothetical protein